VGISSRRRALLLVAIPLGLALFLFISLILARVFSADGAERTAIAILIRDEAAGNRDPYLTLFGRAVTPNLHALADRFGLLDNFYADAEVSADGHNWINGADDSTRLGRSSIGQQSGTQVPHEVQRAGHHHQTVGAGQVTCPGQRILRIPVQERSPWRCRHGSTE